MAHVRRGSTANPIEHLAALVHRAEKRKKEPKSKKQHANRHPSSQQDWSEKRGAQAARIGGFERNLICFGSSWFTDSGVVGFRLHMNHSD